METPGQAARAPRTEKITAADGTTVVTHTWLPPGGPDAVRGWVQLVHGAAEHALRYDRFARALTGRGLA
ncbi:alpha/beta hydrolase, partial [Streptomyces harbinensis]|uniref:alpha/beta hydrolase n=1 Tax=Streptomyces harbinensis TaxID=1176198 RepID=UPI0034DE1853